jgi:hypothetical protein
VNAAGELYGMNLVRKMTNKAAKHAVEHRREIPLSEVLGDWCQFTDEDFDRYAELFVQPDRNFLPTGERAILLDKFKWLLPRLIGKDDFELLWKLHCDEYTHEMLAVLYTTTPEAIRAKDEKILTELRELLGDSYPDTGKPLAA